MNKPLFLVAFKGGTNYVGNNDYKKTGWLDIPNKSIKRIFFLLPDGNYLCLSGYEKYNRVTEATMDLNGSNSGKTIIRYIYFMGLKKGIITSYRVTMFSGKPGKDKFKKGDITRREYEFGKEWYGGKTKGWK